MTRPYAYALEGSGSSNLFLNKCLTMHFRLDSPEGMAVELLLFESVRNAAVLRSLVVSGELDVAALNASLVRSSTFRASSSQAS